MKVILGKKESRNRSLRIGRQRDLEATAYGLRSSCDPDNIDLTDYLQWNGEIGYWVGNYTFLGGDGNPYVSSTWNRPYNHYKGFITGTVNG